jgi:hypothetical protein
MQRIHVNQTSNVLSLLKGEAVEAQVLKQREEGKQILHF